MRQVIKTERIPIKLWLDDIDEGAMEQARNLANLRFAFRHIAIMPDSHQGFGMPIGGVMATKGAVIPNAVGVDIGCGMCAVRTSLKNIKHKELQAIIDDIRQLIPVGFKHHAKPVDEKLMPKLESGLPMVKELHKEALYQLGTLGGGNHFIEIQQGNDGHVWIMIHSGSRNFGYRIADYYNKLACELNIQWKDAELKKQQLAYLPLDSVDGQTYLKEMQYCVDFALANRKYMMGVVQDLFSTHTKANFYDFVNIAHNYAREEDHFGEQVIVHRKGATSARLGESGIIPGSQGTHSYIVTGKGNQESFKSCSHGAGRVMGRRQAMKKLDLHQEIESMNSQGIIHGIRSVSHLDEAPGAYKDILKVMNNQKDLVSIKVELQPLAVVKG